MPSSSDFLENYHLAEPTVRGLYDSKLRLAILDALKDGPMRLADLRRAVGANAPNTSTKAKDLEGMGIVERVDGDFQLTPYGRAVLENTQESLDFYATYEKFKDFFEPRDLSGVPDFLLRRLGELKNSQMITEAPKNLKSIDDYYYKLFLDSKKFTYGVAPIWDPEWLRRCIPQFKGSYVFEMVLTKDAIEGIGEGLSRRDKEAVTSYPRCKAYVIEELKLLFGVTAEFLGISFKDKNSKRYFQQESDILSFDPKAIRWGMDLFYYYRKLAKPVKLADYL